MFKLDLENAEEPEIKLPTFVGSLKKREFQKNIYFCFVDSAKVFDCMDHNKLRKILKEMGIPDHLTYFLRNLYAGQEAAVTTGHGTTNWFQIGKGVHQGCILSPCLFNLNAEYIMWNARLDEAQAGINIAGRNINNLRYADDTTLMAENEEKLKSILMKVKEESERGEAVTPRTIARQAPLFMWILQARIREWVATLYSRGSSWPKGRTHSSCVSHIGRQILYHWATFKAYWNNEYLKVKSQ